MPWCCELVRRHISDSLIAEVNHLKNRHKDIYNLDTSVVVNNDCNTSDLEITSVKQTITESSDKPVCKQQKDNKALDLIDRQYICNELLCFIQNKMDIMPQPMVVKTAVDFFSDHEVKAAKDLLFETCKYY